MGNAVEHRGRAIDPHHPNAEYWVEQAAQAMRALAALGVDGLPHDGGMLALPGTDQLYRVFFDAMGEAAATVDSEGLVLRANARMGALFGCEPDQLLGTCLPSALGGLPAARDGAPQGWRGRAVLHARTGRRPVLCTIQPVTLDGGTRLQCIVLADLAEIEDAERRAREHEHLLAGLAQAMPGALVRARMLAGAWQVEVVGAGARDLLGADSALGEIDALALWGSLSEDARQRLRGAWRDARGGVIRAELPHAAADGRPCWLGLEVHPEGAGSPASSWIGYIADITHAKRVEEDRQLAQAIFESAKQGIMITTPEGLITRVNPGFERITGYEAREAIGRPVKMLASGLTHPEVYRSMWSALRAVGRWEGELVNRRRNGEVFDELLTIDAIPSVDGGVAYYVGVFGDITERKRREERAHFLAHHEPLTGLANRATLEQALPEAIARARRGGERLAVVFLDLDHFKEVNDRAGHAVGDAVLVETARRLQAAVRRTDLVVRLGGDEFVLVMPSPGDDVAVNATCGLVLRALATPYVVDGHAFDLGGSLGVALFPEDGVDAASLMNRADAAMYEAKRAGRGHARFFDEARNTSAAARARALDALASALADHAVTLDLVAYRAWPGRAIAGFEARPRWPGEDAEALAIGADPAWIGRQPAGVDLVLHALAALPGALRQGVAADAEAAPVALRVPPSLLEDGEACARLLDAVRTGGVPPARLALRLGAREAAALAPAALAGLAALREAGLRLQLADVDADAPVTRLLASLAPDWLVLAPAVVGGCAEAPIAAFVRILAAGCGATGATLAAGGVAGDAEAERLAALGVAAIQD